MRRPVVIILAGLVAAIAGAALTGYGIYVEQAYAASLFALAPCAIGFVASAVLKAILGSRPVHESITAAIVAGVLLTCAFLFTGREGAVCIVLALPIASPFLISGGIIGYHVFHKRQAPTSISGALILCVAAILTVEPRLHREPPVAVVEDSVLVHATPAEVWSAVVTLDQVPTPKNWMYRAGLTCPERTRIESPRAGGTRVCTLSTGQLVEQIDVWQPERTLRWHSRSTPPPMRELNPFYDHVDAPHLHGYYTSPRGEFAIEPLRPHLTRLTRRTWYSVRIYPNLYWRIFCEMAISQIHRTVLDHVRDVAERNTRV